MILQNSATSMYFNQQDAITKQCDEHVLQPTRCYYKIVQRACTSTNEMLLQNSATSMYFNQLDATKNSATSMYLNQQDAITKQCNEHVLQPTRCYYKIVQRACT